MSNHHYPRRLLDDAIDRAVHELVQSDPRPGFRRRVMTKVAAPARRSSWTLRLLLPAGAMTAVALLALWVRPEPASRTAPRETIVAEQRPPAASSETQAPSPVAAAPSTRPAAGRRTAPRSQAPVPFTFGPRTDRVAATSVQSDDADAVAAGPLTEREADTLLSLPPVRISPIEIVPIVIKPIEVKPIGFGSSPAPRQ